MTLDDAIAQYEYKVEELINISNENYAHHYGKALAYSESASKYKQVLDWLKDYKRLLEENTAEWVNGICSHCGAEAYEDNYMRDILTTYCHNCGCRMKNGEKEWLGGRK